MYFVEREIFEKKDFDNNLTTSQSQVSVLKKFGISLSITVFGCIFLCIRFIYLMEYMNFINNIRDLEHNI
uniref:Uncharacterized protein n=1 Tax=Megaselia scalaris TaxID=36166 RepID=T1GAG0_MEGSC